MRGTREELQQCPGDRATGERDQTEHREDREQAAPLSRDLKSRDADGQPGQQRHRQTHPFEAREREAADANPRPDRPEQHQYRGAEADPGEEARPSNARPGIHRRRSHDPYTSGPAHGLTVACLRVDSRDPAGCRAASRYVEQAMVCCDAELRAYGQRPAPPTHCCWRQLVIFSRSRGSGHGPGPEPARDDTRGWPLPTGQSGERLSPTPSRGVIAVGTAVAGGPPRGSQRECLAHWALALGFGGEPRLGPRVQDAGFG